MDSNFAAKMDIINLQSNLEKVRVDLGSEIKDIQKEIIHLEFN